MYNDVSPVAKMVHLVLVYKVFFLTVSKSFFNADSKSTENRQQFSEHKSILHPEANVIYVRFI